MKRALISSIIFFAILAGTASGSEGRFLRWENRIDKLKELKGSIENKNEIDKKVIPFIDKQIGESEKFLDILVRARGGDGSLKVEEREYSIVEIEKKVNEAASQVISLYYVSALLSRPFNTPIKEKIEDEILKYISGKNRGIAYKVNIHERGILALQYLMEEGMGEYENIKEKLLRDILSKTEYDLSRNNYVTNKINLEQLIFKNSFDIVEAFDFTHSEKFNEKYLIVAPQWNFIGSGIRTNEKIHGAMFDYMLLTGIEIPEGFAGRDIGAFEKIIFDSEREKFLQSLETENFGGAKSYNVLLYEIPDFTRMGEAVNDLDKYRSALIRNMTGTEGEKFIEKVKNNNRGLSAKYIKHYEKVFKREEARIGGLKKGSPSAIVYNEEIFAAAKNHFIEIKAGLENYEELCSGFVERVVLSGSMSVDEYIAFHKYISSRLLEQGEFMQRLAENSVILSRADSKKVTSLYRSVYNRSVRFVRDILKIDPIPFEIRGGMSTDTLNEYSAVNRDFRKRGRLIAQSMRGDFNKYSAAVEEREREVRKNSIGLETKIGEEEMRIYVTYAADCADLLSSLNYTEKALLNYRDKYNMIESDLRKNNLKDYKKIISKESLIPAVENFNPDLIERETATRGLLSKEGVEALSSAAALNTFYRRQGIVIAHYPTGEELKSLRKNLKPSISVRVADWNMDGENFRRVDLNVLEVLKKNLTRQAWVPGEGEPDGEMVSFSPSEKGVSFSAMIPAGWQRRSSNGMVFESPDKKGTIEIEAVKKGEGVFEVFPGEWLQKRKFSMVQQRWGKMDGTDYHWSLSRVKGNTLAEVYMIECKGYIVIISGKSSVEKQKYLSIHIEGVLKDLSLTPDP